MARRDVNPRDEINRLDRLGGCLRRAGDTQAAEQAYREALAVADKSLASGDLTTARVRNNLAVLLKFVGRFDEATVLYERSLKDFEATLGSEHIEVATVLHNIG